MTTALHFSPYVPYTLPEMADVPAPTAGDDGKALTYRSSLNDFVFTSFEAAGAATSAISTHVGQANPHTQYLLASGYTANDVLTKLLTVDADNTGLNATTLQGSGPSAFAVAAHTHGYQPLDAELTAIAGLTSDADKLPYFSDSGTAALADFTSYGRGLVASANVAATGLLAADGAVTGATAGAQTLTNGVITGKIYPPSNSANAFGFYRANGTTQDFWYDSTNGRFGFGGATTSSAIVTIAGDINIDTAGSSTASPRTINMTNFNSGRAARYAFGDPLNSLQASNGGRLQMQSYWGIEIIGGRQNGTVLGFAAGASGDSSLNVIGTVAANPVLVVTGAASQAGNLQNWRNSALGIQFAIGSAGQLKTNQATANTNTPSGATAYKLEIFNAAGASLGFIPIYASAW